MVPYFFGFSLGSMQCPDACPTARKDLGSRIFFYTETSTRMDRKGRVRGSRRRSKKANESPCFPPLRRPVLTLVPFVPRKWGMRGPTIQRGRSESEEYLFRTCVGASNFAIYLKKTELRWSAPFAASQRNVAHNASRVPVGGAPGFSDSNVLE